ncbi:prepilin-type N-terminal cleavage/methylation domain-containing protein [Rhodoferax sp. AJA081-3]|uniref:type IV pilus modification PilV family protein n=1 Tax=Rhodoferax sp. AJA081-3 TaxID=2752316 RepID=UPI002111E8B7|nr:prepilin-type N-terminal cleavage/methylation domain-containing protein [Rhodoferax sp. AJA081-3]
MRNHCRGMTLMEVLVAFVVLSLTMAVILHIFSGGMRNSRLTDSYSRAVFLAQSRLAAVGVENALVPGEESGRVGTSLQWRVNIARVDDNGEADRLLMPVRQYLVRVQVAWQEDGRDKQIELSSVRLGPRQ